MEGLDTLCGVRAAGGVLESAQRPCVANRCAIDCRTVLGPAGNKKSLEGIPKEENVELSGVAG